MRTENELKALEFAFKAHQGQKRKYTNEPYITHCIAVADIIKTNSDPLIDQVICAAYLHDTIEDTLVTYEDVISEFDKDVADLVLEVTDVSKPSDGNRRARKKKDKEHLANASISGKSIKLADMIHNTQSIVLYDKDFAKVYLREKEELLDVLIGGKQSLMIKAKNLLKENEYLYKKPIKKE